MKKEFNPQEWLDKAKADQSSSRPLVPSSPRTFVPSSPHPLAPSSPDLASEVDQVVTRIEADFCDITTSYAGWINAGFALSHEFGEAGRTNFHRVSRFYNGYTKTETDQQYDRCLKSQGHGITIKTFFHMAKQAGININTNEARNEVNVPATLYRGLPADPSSVPQSLSPSTDQSISPAEEEALPEEIQPTLPDFIFGQLPDFFKRVVEKADSKEERDMLLLGSIVTFGSCLNMFSGIYDGNQVFPTLFLYVCAKASSGKGRLIMCRHLVNYIHWEKRKQYYQDNVQYEIELKEYNAQRGKDLGIEKPKKPPVRLHFIPANNTNAGMLQLLVDNDGEGLMIETEGDTIAKTLGSEVSDFTDSIRKDFHHEVICGYRKTDHEHSEVELPRFCMVLSSTFGQLKKFIPSTENGLSSRFMFYNMNLKSVWKNVFSHSGDKSLKFHFDQLGQEFYSFYCTLREKGPYHFRLTDEEEEEFNSSFARLQDKYLVLQGVDSLAIVRRLGLIAFRIMMIFSIIRIRETGDYSSRVGCREDDFQSAMAMIDTLVRHATSIIAQLPAEAKTEKRGNKKERFFEELPEKFTHKEFVELAKNLNILLRTAERYMSVFCDKGLIKKEEHGIYIKSNSPHRKNDEIIGE